MTLKEYLIDRAQTWFTSTYGEPYNEYTTALQSKINYLATKLDSEVETEANTVLSVEMAAVMIAENLGWTPEWNDNPQQ